MSDETKTLNVRVTGRVQGVGFRWWTRREACSLGLCGWVRNEEDGSVRSVLQGSTDAVREMVERLHHGPAGAVVEEVAVEESTSERMQEGFDILR